MNGKIVDMRGETKNTEEGLSIQKRDLLKKISEIDSEIADEYTKVITDLADKFLKMRNVICSSGKPNTYQHLLSQMDQEEIANLEEIVDLLLAEEPIAQMEKLAELTFDIQHPSKEVVAKSKELIESIKAADVNHAEVAYGFGLLSKRASLLSCVCTLIATKRQEYEKNIQMRLARVSESELDAMLRLVNAM